MTSARHAQRVSPSALDVLAQRALERLAGLAGVTRAGLAVSEGARRQLLFTATGRRDPGGAFEWCLIDATAEVPLNVAVRRGGLGAGTPDELATRFPAFARQQGEHGVAYVAAVPVLDVGEPLGGIVLYYDEPRQLDVHQRRELIAIAASIGAALAKARRDQRRRAAEAWDHDTSTQPAEGQHATYEMSGDQRAVRDVRRFLSTTLGGWDVDPDLVDDAVLCLTELVTNAVVHTHGGCRVHVRLADRVLSVQVVDHGGLGPVRLAPTDDITVHGRGLDIVRALSARMGWDPAHCLAWFELDLQG